MSMISTSWSRSPAATYSSSRGSQIMMCFSPIVCGGTGGRINKTRMKPPARDLNDPWADAVVDVAPVVEVHAEYDGPHVAPERRRIRSDAPQDGGPGEQLVVQLPVAGLQLGGVEVLRAEDHVTTGVAVEVLAQDPALVLELLDPRRTRDRRQDVDPLHRDRVVHDEIVGPLDHRVVVAVQADDHLRGHVDAVRADPADRLAIAAGTVPRLVDAGQAVGVRGLDAERQHPAPAPGSELQHVWSVSDVEAALAHPDDPLGDQRFPQPGAVIPIDADVVVDEGDVARAPALRFAHVADHLIDRPLAIVLLEEGRDRAEGACKRAPARRLHRPPRA